MTATATATRPGRRCRGMTLVELLLGLSSTALIGAAIAAMLSAVSYGTSSSRDMRSLVVRNKVISARFSAAVRDARLVLATGADYIVLWRLDDNENGRPNLGEIQWIELDGETNRLRCFEANFAGLTPEQIEAADTEFTFDADFDAATAGKRGTALFPASLWADSVTNWAVTLNDANAQQASLVSFRFQITNEDASDTLIGAAALRNQ